MKNNGKVIGHYDLIQKPYCNLCAAPSTKDEDCRRNHQFDWFDKVYALGVYYPRHLNMSDMLSDHILKLKKDESFSVPLGISMSIVAKEVFPELSKADGVVPIPLHPEELKMRGFNQSIELANVLSARIDVPVIDALEKNRPQSLQGLGFLARMKMVDGLYQTKDNQNLMGKTLIIVDDVFAAGATCSESAKILKKAYAKSVVVFVAGRTAYSGGKQ